MKEPFKFTFANLKRHFQEALDRGYQFVTCKEFYQKKGSLREKIVVIRVDIDLNPNKAKRIAQILHDQNIKATYFVRLHAPEYNPFSFENYKIFKYLRDEGNELGYHSEIIDQAAIWGEEAELCLKRDIEIFNRMLDITIAGVASHGGMTGLNNLDFWKDKRPADFGLLYEAYDTEPEFNLMNESFYISDSNWTHWKCYNKGKLVEGDHRHPGEHLIDEHPLIYLLIHPETYYDQHFYE